MTLTKITSLALTLVFLGACGISEKKLTAFGETAEETVQVVGLASSVTGDLIAQNEVTRNVCRYMNGNSYTLAAAPSTKMSSLLTDQKNVVAALDAYANAIAGALDAEAQAQIDEASGALATSVADFGEQVDAGAETGPTASLLLNAISQIEKTRRISKIKEEMEKVLPYLNRLRELLQADQKRALEEMDRHIQQWDKYTRCVLAASRRGSNAEAAFRAADLTKRELLANRKRAERAVQAMDALIDAHFQIVYGDGDFEEGIETLNTFLANLQSIKDA